MRSDVWEDPRNIELLKKLWAEGLSCSQIAARIPGTTRNAVIGKRLRLGLPGRGHDVLQANRSRGPKTSGWHTQKAAAAKAKAERAKSAKPTDGSKNPRQPKVLPAASLFAAVSPYSEPEPDIVVPVELRRGIGELTETQCQWPFGDPSNTQEFHWCHHKRAVGLPYCESHSRKAFAPPKLDKAAEPVNLSAGGREEVSGGNGPQKIMAAGEAEKQEETV